jgi:ubiquinone/menaquinone biosynthesis C-methylase UbiE
MSQHESKYIPALSFKVLTPLYDVFFKLTMREELFKGRLIKEARIQSGHKVLDLGCGTGTLTIMIKKAYPGSEVIGLDGDPQVLEIARLKAKETDVSIKFDEGMAYQLPYPDGTFDRVLSSLVFHHLTTPDKERSLAEIYRVLKPDGEFHLADFGEPRGIYAKLVSWLMRRFERVDDNIDGRIPKMFIAAKFSVAETFEFSTLFGTLAFLRGSKS